MQNKLKSILLSGLSLSVLLTACNNSSNETELSKSTENTTIFSNSTLAPIDPNLGEKRSPNESNDIRQIEKFIIAAMDKTYKGKDVKRDVHAKHHGCVKANFQVDNQKLPKEFRVGVFADNNKSFPSWIRFSNGNSSAGNPDTKGDVRGMALKLMNVPGKKIMKSQANAQTQDFLMINTTNFFINKMDDYVSFTKSANKNILSLAGFLITHPSVARRVISIFRQEVSNPLKTDFFSTTPYKLGNTAVRYKFRPCGGAINKKPKNASDNYLKEAMKKTLDGSSACFDFMVQLRKGSFQEMPIENATVDWDQKKSPYIKVARVTIPKQTFDTPKQQSFCENLSFTPWHSLPEHKPLGAVNRARLSVYNTVSDYRHQKNGLKTQEPTNHNIF